MENDTKTTQQRIGLSMRRLRRSQRQTLSRIGVAANTTAATMSRVELGEQWPPAETFFAIGAALKYRKPSAWLRALARELEQEGM